MVQAVSVIPVAGHDSLGIKYAKSIAKKELKLQWSDGVIQEESYRWNRATEELIAGRPAGWMYGLLDLADHSACNCRIPALTVRSYHRWLPFCLGQGYGQEGYSHFDRKAEGWWYDRDWWMRFFQGMAEARLNMLVFWNVHPYPALIEFDEFPEANEFDRERRARNIETFRLILRLAGEFGVDVVIKQYNIHVARGFALKHGIERQKRVGFCGGDTPLTRHYNAYCIRKLFQTYPQLSGLMTCFELNKNAQGFLEQAILRPLQEIPRARLHFRLWGQHFPDDVRRICEALPGRVSLWHKASEEIIAVPRIDPRVAWWHEQFPEVPMHVLVGPSNASGYNYLGRPFVDPHFLARQFAELKQVGGTGIGFTGGDDNQWINDGELSNQSEAMQRWEVPAWLMRHVAGRVAWDLTTTSDHIAQNMARLLEMETETAHRLLLAMTFSSRADLPFWRLNSTYGGQNLGFAGAAGRYSMESQAYAPGTYRLSGPYAKPLHGWGLRQKDVLAAVRDRDTLAEPFLVAGEIESDANAADACLTGEPLPAASGIAGQIIESYARLNNLVARYHADMIRAATCAHRVTRCDTAEEAIERLEEGIRWLTRSAERAVRIGALARAIPAPETSQRPDLLSPHRIERNRGTLLEEAEFLRRAAVELHERPSSFAAFHLYWDALADTYELLHHIPPLSCHIEARAKTSAAAILDGAIAKLQQVSGCVDAGIPPVWLEVLQQDRERLNPRVICCGTAPQEIGWLSRNFAADLPLAEMIASVVPGIETKRPTSRRAEIQPKFTVDVEGAKLRIRLSGLATEPTEPSCADLRIILLSDSGPAYRFRIDLSGRSGPSAQVAVLAPPHALRFLEPFEPDVHLSTRTNGECDVVINCHPIFGSSLPGKFGFNIGFGASGPYWSCVPDAYGDGILAFDSVWMGTLDTLASS